MGCRAKKKKCLRIQAGFTSKARKARAGKAGEKGQTAQSSTSSLRGTFSKESRGGG